MECSRSEFYAWRDPPLSEHYLADVDLAAEIFEIDEASQRTYGTPRVRREARRCAFERISFSRRATSSSRRSFTTPRVQLDDAT